MGSSPRVWGQGGRYSSTDYKRRIIPTRVGTSTWSCFNRCSQTDHPHACGDKGRPEDEPTDEEGSSPRVWGQVDNFLANLNMLRIIPTRVGTRADPKTSLPMKKDHPHACGDKIERFQGLDISRGSSPRVWGQVQSPQTVFPVFGIIPTRVGTSGDYKDYTYDEQDHPHACGDKTSQRTFL